MENLPEVIKALQSIHDNQAALLAVGDAKAKAEAELKSVQQSLETTRGELKSQTSGLTQAQVEIKRSYDKDLNDAQMKLKDLQKLIAEGSAKLAELDANVRAKQELHDMIVRSLDVLRGRIEGKAA